MGIDVKRNFLHISQYFASALFLKIKLLTLSKVVSEISSINKQASTCLVQQQVTIGSLSLRQLHIFIGGFSIGHRGREPHLRSLPQNILYHFWDLIINLKSPLASF